MFQLEAFSKDSAGKLPSHSQNFYGRQSKKGSCNTSHEVITSLIWETKQEED